MEHSANRTGCLQVTEDWRGEQARRADTGTLLALARRSGIGDGLVSSLSGAPLRPTGGPSGGPGPAGSPFSLADRFSSPQLLLRVRRDCVLRLLAECRVFDTEAQEPCCSGRERRKYVDLDLLGGHSGLCSPYFCPDGGNCGDREATTSTNGPPPDSVQRRAGSAGTNTLEWLPSCGPEAFGGLLR
jgi:hypothetical protein